MAPSNSRNNVINLPSPGRLPAPRSLTDKGITPEQWRVLVDVTFPTAQSAESVEMAIDYCRARNLDIFKKPVHIVPMWNASLRRLVETIWPGINEIQITAARTGAWAGMDSPKWGPNVTRTFEGEKKGNNGFQKVSVQVTFPEWCEVTVYRIVGGQRCAFCEPVYWTEAYSTTGGKSSELPTDMWIKRPRGQLHKVAKAAALRAAFPEEGEYTAEEMEGKEIENGGVVIEGAAVQVPSNDDHLADVVKFELDVAEVIAEINTVEELGKFYRSKEADIVHAREVNEKVGKSILSKISARKKELLSIQEKRQAEGSDVAEQPTDQTTKAPAGSSAEQQPEQPSVETIDPPWTIDVRMKDGEPYWEAFVETMLDTIKRIPNADWGVQFRDLHRSFIGLAGTTEVGTLGAIKTPVMNKSGKLVSGADAAKRLRNLIEERIAELVPAAAE